MSVSSYVSILYIGHMKSIGKNFLSFNFWKKLSETDVISSLNIWKNLEVKPYRHGDLFAKSAQL